MTFTGKVEGEVVVCFEQKLAREVVASIMATEPEKLTKEELWEGIGEIVNIVAGNAKAALSATEYQHQKTLPAVVF
jgi:CheY-specific phosphatase CheX